MLSRSVKLLGDRFNNVASDLKYTKLSAGLLSVVLKSFVSTGQVLKPLS